MVTNQLLIVLRLGMHTQVATQLEFGDGWQGGSAFFYLPSSRDWECSFGGSANSTIPKKNSNGFHGFHGKSWFTQQTVRNTLRWMAPISSIVALLFHRIGRGTCLKRWSIPYVIHTNIFTQTETSWNIKPVIGARPSRSEDSGTAHIGMTIQVFHFGLFAYQSLDPSI